MEKIRVFVSTFDFLEVDNFLDKKVKIEMVYKSQ